VRDDPQLGKGRLRHHGTGGRVHDGRHQGDQRPVDRPGGGQVARADRADEVRVAVGGDVAHHAEHAGGAGRQVRQVQFVDAAVVGQRGAGHDGHRLEQVALRVLHRLDARVSAEFGQRRRRHRETGSGRDVVEHHR
jgi:hypothetical protein